MKKEKIVAFAKENGYDGALPLGKWKEYDAYEPTFDDTSEENLAFVGPPLMILVKGEEIRMSTVEEAFEQIAEAEDEEDEEDDE